MSFHEGGGGLDHHQMTHCDPSSFRLARSILFMPFPFVFFSPSFFDYINMTKRDNRLLGTPPTPYFLSCVSVQHQTKHDFSTHLIEGLTEHEANIICD